MKKLSSILLFIFFATPLFSSDILNIKAFTAEGETEIYEPENLFEYIDGAADIFLSFGFQQLQVRDFSFENLKFSVELYHMGSPLNSFGIYKNERPQKTPGLKIGAEAVVSPPYQALMLKGDFYVKINVYEGEIDSAVAFKILNAIADALPGEDSFPSEISMLPVKNKLPGTEGFAREAFLGMSLLKRCLFASYSSNDSTKFRYFIMLPEENEQIQNLWKELAANWKPIRINGTIALLRKIPYKGIAGVIQKNGKIYGVADCKDDEHAKKQLLQLLK